MNMTSNYYSDDDIELYYNWDKHTNNINYTIGRIGILESSKNKENAHKFIEFIHRPEIYALVAAYLMLPSINVHAVEFMEEEPLFTLEDLENAELLKDTTPTLELQNKYWEEIKMHN